MLAWVWRGVLAFDRIGQRIPQLVQMMVVELAIAFCIGGFVASVIDGVGGFGCPGTGAAPDGTSWVALGVGLFFAFFFVRNVFWPRLVEGAWTPMVRTPLSIGDVGIALPNRKWAVSYRYLTSHPSYGLVLLPVSWIFIVMVLFAAEQGCSLFYNRVFGWAGLGIMAAMALARVIAWYVLRVGRRRLDEEIRENIGPGRAAWEIAWKPVIMLVTMMHVIVALPMVIMWWQQIATIRALPMATIADAAGPGAFRNVAGMMKSELVLWPSGGMGRGSDNYYGGGVLIALDGGGEALLVAGNSTLADLRAAIASAQSDHIETFGRVMGAEISEGFAKYVHATEDDFPPRDPAGRVIIEVGQYP